MHALTVHPVGSMGAEDVVVDAGGAVYTGTEDGRTYLVTELVRGGTMAQLLRAGALSDRDVDLGVSTARSRLNLANILDSASQMNIKALLVGPAPGLDDARNDRVAELNRVYADVAMRRNHHYVDTFAPLRTHAQWRADLNASGGVPGQAGYGLMAWLVLHRGWYSWLQLPEPSAG